MYEARLIGKLNPDRFKTVFKPRDRKTSVIQMIDDISIENKCNILVTGIHGRKKEDVDMTICGSNVSSLLVDPICPLLICKLKDERKDKIGGRYNFLVCVDGSKESLKAIKEALKILNRETDFIEVIHVKKFSITPESVGSMVDKFF